MAALLWRVDGTGVGSSGSSSLLTIPPSRISQAGEALSDEPAYACFARRGEQDVRTFSAQPVGLGEGAVEVPGEANIRERGRLVDDGVGLCFQHGRAHGGWVDQIQRDRFRAERPQAFGV